MSTTAHTHAALIIGAGYGGLGMAAQLRRQGIDDFVVLEKSDRIGGVWRDNIYPGAACDTQSHIYCFSFLLNLRVSRMYAEQPELLAYAHALVDTFGLAPHLRFDAEVVAATWNDSDGVWDVECADGRRFRARVLIPAWGQLGAPSIPDFPGIEDFRGTWFHSARWPEGLDLVGKRVASVGSAASAVQYVPRVADAAERLVVFQRSANYILPRNQIVFDEQQLDTFESDPEVFRASRDAIHRMREDGFARVTRGSDDNSAAVAEFFAHLDAHVTDPELRAKLVPDYEYGCKRILRSDDYLPALARDNVEVETERIERIEPHAIVTADGRRHEVDVIVMGTGFRSQAFHDRIVITGRSGTLSDRWGDAPEAYLGMAVDGFPNMFMIYGPNTNLNHNSVVSMMELQQDYIVRALRALEGRPGAVLEVRPEPLRAFVERVQDELNSTAFVSDCSSWYKNADGRVINNWSGTVDDYRLATSSLELHHYALA